MASRQWRLMRRNTRYVSKHLQTRGEGNSCHLPRSLWDLWRTWCLGTHLLSYKGTCRCTGLSCQCPTPTSAPGQWVLCCSYGYVKVCFLLFFFESRSHSVAQANLVLVVILCQPPPSVRFTAVSQPHTQFDFCPYISNNMLCIVPHFSFL